MGFAPNRKAKGSPHRPDGHKNRMYRQNGTPELEGLRQNG